MTLPRANGLRRLVPTLIIILFPLITSLFSLFLFRLHDAWPFLVSSLHDFSERVTPNINRGLLPYRDFPFEYPPLFYAVIFLTNMISDIYKIAGGEKLFAVHFFFLVPVIFTIYLILVPKEYIIKVSLIILVSLPLIGASFDFIATFLVVITLILFTRGFDGFSFLTLAVATGIKIYPIIYLPLLFLRWRSLRRNLLYLTFFSFLVVLPFLLVLGFNGSKGLVESFSYQFSRGIEYESIMAVPHFLLANFKLVPDIYYFRNFSYDISYGDLDRLLWFLGVIAFFVFYLSAVTRILRVLHSKERQYSVDSTFLFDAAYTLTLVLLIFSKLLSAQFIIWPVLLLPFVSPALFRKSYRVILTVVILTIIETGITFRHQQFTSLPLIFRNIFLIIASVSAWNFFRTRLDRFN